MQLSEHFTLEEMCSSKVASRRGLDNTPGPVEIENLKLVAATMETIRLILGGLTIHVDSGYRSPAVNTLIGGAGASAHCKGLACDFVCPEFGTPYAVAQAIALSGMVEYDQLILEHGWVHLSLSIGKMRGQELTKKSASGPYLPGIVK
jgi:zinc D-Ala-D-Ala carboxypeptidase